ncbi:hypothetical protein HZ994_04005 [Akkermansiaceae bacterium]|nr:hypothetical protein HZ994_04005 [Akkermansiaceae bacterium]
MKIILRSLPIHLSFISSALLALPAVAQYSTPPPPEIVSAWKLDSENVVVIFRHDGVFYFIDGMTGHLGMERGTYEWDKDTGAFSVDVIVDTNDDAGLSHPGAATTVSIVGNTLNYTVAGEGTFALARVVNTANAIVGSWHLPGLDANVTFLSDGTYYHSEESDNEPESTTGMERGTYSWNSSTGALSATPITDTNGDIGLSNPTPSFNATITGNIMTLVEGDETYVLRRITPILAPLARNDFEVDKFANYRQSSAAAPSLLPGPPNDDQPFWGEAYIDTVSGTGGTLGITGQAVQNFVNDDGWSIAKEYTTLSALNAASAFPNGANYTFSRTGGSATLSFPANGAFPPAPAILGNGENGAWNNGVYVLGQNQTLIWSAHTAFDPTILVTVLTVVDQDTGFEIMKEEVIQGDIVSYDFRGKLTPGATYDVILEHVKIAGSTTSGTGPFAGKLGYALYNSNTRFSMATENRHVHTLVAWKQKISGQQSPSLLSPIGAAFNAGVEGSGISATFPSSNITLTKPDSSTVPFQLDIDRWDAGAEFASFAELQTAFPDGTYNINIGGDPTPIIVSGANYPNQPLVTSSAGTWVNGKLRITASQAAAGFTLSSNHSTGNGFETLDVLDVALDEYVVRAVNDLDPAPQPTDTSVSASIGPNLLTVGKSYEVEVEFDEVVDFTALQGKPWGLSPDGSASAFGLLSSTTLLTIEVIADSPPVVEFVVAVKDVRHFQTGQGTVILDPSPVTPTNGGPFGFAAGVQGQNMVSLPAPTVTPPPGTPSTIQDPFYNTLFFDAADDELSWRYGPDANDWGATSQAGIDNRFPNGTYTFLVNGVSVPLSLTGDAYPNIPQLTLTGGSWINGKYAMDAANALTVTTNTFTGYGSNVDGRVFLEINDTSVEHFRSSSPATNFATLSVPSNSLPLNDISRIDAEFGAIVSKSNAIPGSYSAALYARQLKAEVHILPKIITQSPSRVMQPNTSVNLEVAATGSPMSPGGSMLYQWRKNGVILPDESSSTLAVLADSAGISGTYTCTVSNSVGSATTEPIIIEYADAYQAYATGFALNSATGGAPDGDFDNDGIDNLLEFVLGGSPTDSNPNLLKNATTTPAATGRNLVFFYDRKSAASSVNVVLETSPSLTGIWTAAIHGVNGVVISTSTLDGSTQRVTATIPSEETKLFVRLRATR